MLDELVYLLLGAIVLLAMAFARPERATCPPGFYALGVRPSGATECVHAPAPCGPDCGGPRACGEPPPEYRHFPAQIYCTGGSVPIVVNERTVGCTMRPGS